MGGFHLSLFRVSSYLTPITYALCSVLLRRIVMAERSPPINHFELVDELCEIHEGILLLRSTQKKTGEDAK